MVKQKINWQCVNFAEMDNVQLYQLLALRSEVFVVEQNCAYQDLDDLDEAAWHLCAYSGEQLVAYLRILAPGVNYAEAAIGRVITRKNHRGKGIGNALMRRGLAAVKQYYPGTGVRLSAQAHLQKFYKNIGFVGVGSEYLEDNIPHREMYLMENKAALITE